MFFDCYSLGFASQNEESFGLPFDGLISMPLLNDFVFGVDVMARSVVALVGLSHAGCQTLLNRPFGQLWIYLTDSITLDIQENLKSSPSPEGKT